MKLCQFRVTCFRSVEDSGWIDVNQLSCLIGANEAGKTNLLIPLWKFNPASGGTIDPMLDYPRKQFSALMEKKLQPTFIRTVFSLNENLRADLAAIAGIDMCPEFVMISRDFAGHYQVEFHDSIDAVEKNHDAAHESKAAFSQLKGVLLRCYDILHPEDYGQPRHIQKIKHDLIAHVDHLENNGPSPDSNLTALLETLLQLPQVSLNKTSQLSALCGYANDGLSLLQTTVHHPLESDAVKAMVLNRIPQFVYYSNYGNIDSEIYLPQVLKNFERNNLGIKESARLRTLQRMFEYLELAPQELMYLGREYYMPTQQPTERFADIDSDKKKRRHLLLQAASIKFTENFRQWWKQGNYTFRFQVDGNHFRIWVSDDRRMEEIELECRSSSLQWFFSFYLVLITENEYDKRQTILLLDEPGVSLHPSAQEDLLKFFKQLSEHQQILFTTHSPFMVDIQRLDKVKAVYLGDQGNTQVAEDLKYRSAQPERNRSIYTAHAAIGLSISELILQGSTAVLISKPSDKYYLNAIKHLLISEGLIQPQRELLFIPAAEFDGIQAIAAIVAQQNKGLPYVLFDDQLTGKNLKAQLANAFYQAEPDKLIDLEPFTGFTQADITDLLPGQFMADITTRYLNCVDVDFEQSYQDNQPITDQIIQFSQEQGVTLAPDWETDLALRARDRIIRYPKLIANDNQTLRQWIELFNLFAA